MELALGLVGFIGCFVVVVAGILAAYSVVGLIVSRTAQARDAEKIVHW